MIGGSIVIDSSALFDLLLPARRFAQLDAAIGGRELNAPDVIGLEVLSALRRQARLGQITDEQAGRAVERLHAAPIRYWRSLPLASRIWQLRHNVSASDAAYVVLAQMLGCSLMTVDERLRRTPNLPVAVIP